MCMGGCMCGDDCRCVGGCMSGGDCWCRGGCTGGSSDGCKGACSGVRSGGCRGQAPGEGEVGTSRAGLRARACPLLAAKLPEGTLLRSRPPYVNGNGALCARQAAAGGQNSGRSGGREAQVADTAGPLPPRSVCNACDGNAGKNGSGHAESCDAECTEAGGGSGSGSRSGGGGGESRAACGPPPAIQANNHKVGGAVGGDRGCRGGRRQGPMLKLDSRLARGAWLRTAIATYSQSHWCSKSPGVGVGVVSTATEGGAL